MMKSIKRLRFKVFLLVCLFSIESNAQSLKGVTGKPDTSFTTNSAYNYTKKNYPNIAIIQEFHYKDVYVKKAITYCELEERKLLLDAFSPINKSSKKVPGVIMIHGGGWRSGSRSQHYPLAESLAHLGYVCFTPEYRLSTEALFPAAVYDIKAAIRWVKANAFRFNVDTAKIAIAGFSAGGELAAFMATTGNMPLFEGCNCNQGMSTNVQALINIDGTLSFVNAESGEGNDKNSTSAATYWFGYPKKNNEVLWKAASPLTYVSCQTPPSLFLNSSLPRMHAGREEYINVLDSCKIYSQVRDFEGAPHSFCLFDPWFEPTVKYMDDFLKQIFQ